MSLQFINSDLKQKVDRIMDELFAGGVNNPMTSIEQISYLMFLKSLTELDEHQERIAKLSNKKYESIFNGKISKFSWRVISRLSGDELYNTLVDAFENLHELPKLTSTGKTLFRQAHLKIYNRPTLKSVVSIIDSMDYNNSEKYDTDVKGDMYEYLLNRIAVSGTNGQFRTPRHIIKMMIELSKPKPSDLILDPACGTAGFLIEAYKYILRTNTSEEELKTGHATGDKLTPAQHEFLRTKAINGFDNDADMIKVAIMNLYLHDLSQSNVLNFDPLTLPEEKKRKYDLVLANPPFSGNINSEAIQEDIGLNTTKTELLFLKYMYDHLADGGRCAVVVPEGVLFGSTGAHRKLRELFIDTCQINAVVSLPSGVFKPYAGVKTAIIFYTKGGKTDKVWFYEVTGDGFTLDDRRHADPSHDNLKDLPKSFEKKEVGPHSWFATRDEVVAEEYNLTASRYKPMSAEVTNHRDPREIIDEVLSLEKEITEGLESLKKKLS
ncbi:MAG: type I restriction-modification system subunit M [Candidatus Pacebacteria bacterium]|nr:type I restriction-modification system subunit M [Candidatus Paceibacterota bacterium]